MITIDDLLKDDPKALEELKDMRKWMDQNPQVFNFPEEKKTQGQKKMKQLLEDVRRDKKFAKKIAPLTTAKPTYKPEELQMLYALYRRYLLALHLFRKEFLLKDKNYRLRKAI